MTPPWMVRCSAYLEAQATILTYLGWGYPMSWWLPRPEGVQ